MKQKNDYAFKKIMMNENVRIGFLSAMLGIDPSDMKETHILNTFLHKEHETDKLGILDVRILLNNEMEIDMQIQLAELAVWPERSLFIYPKCSQSRLSREKITAC